MIQAYQDHTDALYLEPVADLAPTPAVHDQFPLVPPVLVDMVDESSDSNDDSGYDPEGESDMDIESDTSNIFPNPITIIDGPFSLPYS